MAYATIGRQTSLNQWSTDIHYRLSVVGGAAELIEILRDGERLL